MTRRWCRECGKYEWAQATQVDRRPMNVIDWSLAIVVGGYLLMLAWAVQ